MMSTQGRSAALLVLLWSLVLGGCTASRGVGSLAVDSSAPGSTVQPPIGVTAVSIAPTADTAGTAAETPAAGETDSGVGEADAAASEEAQALDVIAPVGEGPVQTYTDDVQGISITYGANYRLLTTADVTKYTPAPLSEVQVFPLAAVENNATDYAPPALAIRVYPNPQGLSLAEWVSAQPRWGAPGASQEEATVGGLTGVRVCGAAPVEPVCAIFFAHRSAIVALVPSGPEGNALLGGVEFIP